MSRLLEHVLNGDKYQTCWPRERAPRLSTRVEEESFELVELFLRLALNPAQLWLSRMPLDLAAISCCAAQKCLLYDGIEQPSPYLFIRDVRGNIVYSGGSVVGNVFASFVKWSRYI